MIALDFAALSPPRRKGEASDRTEASIVSRDTYFTVTRYGFYCRAIQILLSRDTDFTVARCGFYCRAMRILLSRDTDFTVARCADYFTAAIFQSVVTQVIRGNARSLPRAEPPLRRTTLESTGGTLRRAGREVNRLKRLRAAEGLSGEQSEVRTVRLRRRYNSCERAAGSCNRTSNVGALLVTHKQDY